MRLCAKMFYLFVRVAVAQWYLQIFAVGRDAQKYLPFRSLIRTFTTRKSFRYS